MNAWGVHASDNAEDPQTLTLIEVPICLPRFRHLFIDICAILSAFATSTVLAIYSPRVELPNITSGGCAAGEDQAHSCRRRRRWEDTAC